MPTDRVFLRDGERCWIVPVAEIALLEAEGNYARVFFGANRPLIRSALNALEKRLDPSMFFRASRRHLINLRFVEHVDQEGVDSYLLRLRSGQTVRVSRRQSRRLVDALRL